MPLQTFSFARIYFNKLICLLVCVAFSPSLFGETPTAKDVFVNFGKEWRKEALNRKRRVIYDNDGNEALRGPEAMTAEALLKMRTTAIAGSHVDAIFYCSNAGFGTTSRASQVWTIFATKDGNYSDNQTGEFIEAGLDPLKVMIGFGKKHNIEVFANTRMNDTHDAHISSYGPTRWDNNPFKKAHLDCLMGAKEQKLKHGAWAAVNYAKPEVRESMLAYQTEACQNYDIAGLELDFFRHPVFFKETTVGKKVSQENCDLMTDLIRRIRSVAEVEGKKRGRPILISVRVPDSVEYAKAIGLDIEKWMEDDLIDILCVSSYFKLNDWDYSVKLGHQYGVKVYPSLDESRVRDPEASKLRTSNLAARGRAMNVWHSGADGVLFFNAFEPTDPLWRETGDPKLLKTLDKDYFGSVRGAGGAAGGNLPYNKYQTVETLNPAIPKKLSSDTPVTSKLLIGETITSPTKAVLKLRFQDEAPEGKVTIFLNGKEVKGTVRGEWIDCPVEPNLCVPGENKVEVQATQDLEKPIRWTDVMLSVRHPKK